MADACAEAIAVSGVDASQVPTVFGSALGEAPTMISLMDQMCRGEETSPMRFATSVHSAASGVVSISDNNKTFTTSLSADYDTVAAALLEAWGAMQTMRSPVVVVCGDDPSPEDFVAKEEAFERLAVALALGPAGSEGSLGEISLPQHEGAITCVGDDVPPDIARNPVVGALDLVSALRAKRSGVLQLDRGRGSGYRLGLVSAE